MNFKVDFTFFHKSFAIFLKYTTFAPSFHIMELNFKF